MKVKLPHPLIGFFPPVVNAPKPGALWRHFLHVRTAARMVMDSEQARSLIRSRVEYVRRGMENNYMSSLSEADRRAVDDAFLDKLSSKHGW